MSNDNKTKEQLQQELDALKLAFERAKTPQKDLPSEFFCDKERNERKLVGLSETAKHFETKQPALAEKIRQYYNVDKLTIKEFHAVLVEAVEKL